MADEKLFASLDTLAQLVPLNSKPFHLIFTLLFSFFFLELLHFFIFISKPKLVEDHITFSPFTFVITHTTQHNS